MAHPGVVGGRLLLDHVDVFADRPMAGNGLTVVTSEVPLTDSTMLRIAQELRQFETIFLFEVSADGAAARIFTPEEELAFAGHPVLGAAAVLHRRSAGESAGESAASPDERSQTDRDGHVWNIRVGGRPLTVDTTAVGNGVIMAEMDQGLATLSPPLPHDQTLKLAAAVGVQAEQLRDDLPAQVVSTGLPYLLLPVNEAGLAGSHPAADDLPSMLRASGADFVYVLEPDRPEGRTWDNRGVTEDVATGSAAGPVAAYLMEHRLRTPDDAFHVHQGRFVGRPSLIDVRRAADGSLRVGGPVAPFSSGAIDISAWAVG
jgi:trans-2,3-dihydro-3-hydroxyanthranilate isomerase